MNTVIKTTALISIDLKEYAKLKAIKQAALAVAEKDVNNLPCWCMNVKGNTHTNACLRLRTLLDEQ